MFGLRKTQSDDGLPSSVLLNQDNFYGRFTNNLLRAKYAVIIESPFVSSRRLNYLLPILRKLVRCKVKIVINTKLPEEQDSQYAQQAGGCIALLQQLGVEVLITGGHHRKLAIIDRQILYEGSLNILSQSDSCKIMSRIESRHHATQMLHFTKLERFLDN